MSITRRKYNRFGERTDLKPTITFRDDYAVNLRTGEEYIPMKHCQDIKNDVQRHATAMRLAGASNEQISKVVAEIRDAQLAEKKGLRMYACTCNNWGPRFIENSRDLCCPGCWQWAIDHHYEYSIHGQAKWLTCDWAEGNTWGINVKKLRELNGK